jgi:hypothetical protein
MNILFKVNLCFIFLLCLSDLKGQTDFRPGYVITNENDTLHGLIDYRGDTRNSKICVFKENATSASSEYLPGQIKAYRFSGSKYYVSKNILANGTKKDFFLEFLVNGIADLYYYRDVNNPHYFIEKRDGQLFELNNTEELIKKDDIEYFRQKKEYIGLLKYAFADCPQLFEKINNTVLDTKSLVNITKKYHNYVCDDEKCIIYEKQLPTIKLTLAPFVSMNASFLSIGNGGYVYETMKFQPSTYPSIGVLLNSSLPSANEKLSFQVSAEIGQNYFYGTGSYVGNNSFNEVHLHSTVLMGKGGFKYTYPTGRFRPTFMVGAHIAALVDKKGRRIEEKNENGTICTYEYNEDMLSKENYGYNVDFGIDYHDFSSFIPFMDIGFMHSTGVIMQSRTISGPKTNLITICINAGLYF